MFAFTGNVQPGFELPAHGPAVQPVNVPMLGDANSVMLVPAAKLAVHIDPQLMPAGVLVTVPLP